MTMLNHFASIKSKDLCVIIRMSPNVCTLPHSPKDVTVLFRHVNGQIMVFKLVFVFSCLDIVVLW